MSEKPLEWMTVCGEGRLYKAVRIGTLMIGCLIFLFMLVTGFTPGVIGVVLFAGISGAMQIFAYLEYEFCYFDDELEIAAIYNKARRRKKMSFSINDVEYMVKGIEKQDTTRFFCKKADNGKVYTILLNQQGKRTAVVLEADSDFVRILEEKQKLR